MEINFKSKLFELLKKDSRLWNKETDEFNETLLKDLVDKLDENVLELLFNNAETKEQFFIKIKDAYVLKQNELKFFIDENKLDNSFTQLANKIGLNIDDKKNERVVLNWPFKDCVLEGGMTKEDAVDVYYKFDKKAGEWKEETAKRKEIFFNEILARDEIDRLEDPKAFYKWRRFTAENSEKVEELKEIKRDENGVIRENFVIKGNNLLALHSLKEEFEGKIKLIYIDPPYNTGGDSFGYNDNFNHSAWLTFMKNRLEIASELLRDDGAIFVHIDHHEVGPLSMIMDEVFLPENKVQIISVKTASPAGFKTVNPGPIDVTEYILFYTKSKKRFPFKKMYVKSEYDGNYNLWIDNPQDNPEKWVLKSLVDVVYEKNDIKIGKTHQESAKNAKIKWGEHWKVIRDQITAQVALENAERIVSVRDPHKPTEKLKELLHISKSKRDKVFPYQKNQDDDLDENIKFGYVYNGGALSFYSNKVKLVDGEKTPTVLLTDFWADLSWDGIAKEGAVKLKNGKKPEKLLRRIIEMATDKESDIVLDYHAGSGTTSAVAHKMKRQWIAVEQLDYSENNPEERMKGVIAGDQSGISKEVNWTGGGDFIYVQLAKWNEEAKEKIAAAKSYDELVKLFDLLYKRYFLNYNVKAKDFKESIIEDNEFKKLSLEKQKEIFGKMLDLNQMYINFSERNDKKYELSPKDIELSEEFYNVKN